MAEKAYKWSNISDKRLHDENPYDYITPNALDAIRNLEGHKTLEDSTFKGKTVKTHTYGITQNGLDGLDNLRLNYGVRVPKEFIDAEVKDLTEDQLRLAAAYNAMLTTKNIEAITNSDGFSRQPLAFRSGILTALHTTSMYGVYKDSYDANKPGSFLRACESGNPYRMLRSIITNADGTPQKEYVKNKDMGLNKRNLAGILLATNPDMTWNDEEKKFWEQAMLNGVFTKNLFNKLKDIEKEYDKAIEKTNNMFYGIQGYDVNNPAWQTPNPENEKIVSQSKPITGQEAIEQAEERSKQPQNEDFWFNVGRSISGALKSFFGAKNNQLANYQENMLNSNEEPNNEAGNQNNNLQ